MTVCHTLDTHTGTLSDFDMNGHHLVTCGFARRHGNLQAVDRYGIYSYPPVCNATIRWKAR
jgi:PAB-dependent poly(A)-specific ribonuclease subunit 2